MNFYERLNFLCKERNISLSHMLSEIGLSTGSTGNWKKGQFPKGDALILMARYLETSVDYLLFGEYYNFLSYDEQKLIDLYEAIPERAKYKLLCDFEEMVEEEIEKLAKEKGAG